MSDTNIGTNEYSGRFLIRIDPGLHGALRAAAEAADLSLNEYCARKLAMPCGSIGDPGADAVLRASSMFGAALRGVAVFGSWVRGEARASSDIDVMILIDDTVPLDRKLYRTWDTEPLSWDGHTVEVHFAYLPDQEERISGLWAELAIDGVVLFEQELAVSRLLSGIRKEIAAGRLVRRTAHGQPYWVHENENGQREAA